MTTDDTRHAKPICFHLPQFHAIPENDRWWEPGFTEWTLTDRATPLYEGHRQPRAPAGVPGRYDLVDREVRRWQGELARTHGIHGFCYYHYWFRGTTLLERPLEAMLEDGQPDLPFCLCWANEPWSRRWSGEERDVLQPQEYGGPDDWDAHFDYLARFFAHPNYIRVEERPLLAIYRLGHIEPAAALLARWRERASSAGFAGLHLVAIEGGIPDSREGLELVDAVAEHQPTCVLDHGRPILRDGTAILPIEQLWAVARDRPRPHPVTYPGASHAWDNTPRRGRAGRVILPSTPARFASYLRTVCDRAESDPSLAEPFVFLNAWNEWSEGAFLEPDAADGPVWLQAVGRALAGEAAPFDAETAAPETGIDLAQPDAEIERATRTRQGEPDVDLLSAAISHGVRGERVLEFGCGAGATGEYLRRILGARRYVGLEPNPSSVGSARELLGEAHHVRLDGFELDAVAASLEVSLEPGAFDIVVCRDLLAAVADPLATLAALTAALRPGGIACLGLPHPGHDAIAEVVGGAPGTGGRRFTRGAVGQLLAASALSPEKLYRVFNPSPPAPDSLADRDNSVQVGAIRISGLDREQVASLFCIRSIVFARRA